MRCATVPCLIEVGIAGKLRVCGASGVRSVHCPIGVASVVLHSVTHLQVVRAGTAISILQARDTPNTATPAEAAAFLRKGPAPRMAVAVVTKAMVGLVSFIGTAGVVPAPLSRVGSASTGAALIAL